MEPTIKTLYHAWVQAEMGSESAGFYEFVSKVTGSTVTRENALQVPHADRQHVCNLIGLKKDVYPYTPALDEEEQAKEMEHFVELDKIGEEVAARRAADKAQPWPATTLDSKQVVNAQAAKAS
jgi:hypothetical protein